MRAVFDTNVLVSAFAAEGLCAGLLIRANRRECRLFLSTSIRREFEDVSKRKLGFSEEEVLKALSLIDEAAAETISVPEGGSRIAGICRDESDHAILEAAVLAEADFLVTGDRELLGLKEFRECRILSPREFELLFQ